MKQSKPDRDAAPDQALALEASHARLEKLVGELLAANEQLRFRLAEMEHQAACLERGLAQSSAAALWP